MDVNIQSLINSGRQLSTTDVDNMFYYFYGRSATNDEKNYWSKKTSNNLFKALQPNASQFTNAKYYKDVISPTSSTVNNTVSTNNNENNLQTGVGVYKSNQSSNQTSSVSKYVPSKNSPNTQTNQQTNQSNSIFDTLIANNPLIQDWLKDSKNKSDFDALDDTLKMAWITSMNSVQQSIEAGKVINNKLDLSNPTVMKRFIDDATTQLDPYYKEQFRQYEQDLGNSLERMDTDYKNAISRSEDDFKLGLGKQAESEAQSGTAFSSGRTDRLGQSITEQQQGIDDATTALLRNKQDLAQNAERTLGSDAFSKFSGKFGANQYQVGQNGYTNIGSRSLFTPQGQLLGSLPGDRTVAINTEANRLAEIKNQQLALNSRTL